MKSPRGRPSICEIAHRRSLAVHCPTCRAKPGVRCHVPGSAKPTKDPHRPRMALLAPIENEEELLFEFRGEAL